MSARKVMVTGASTGIGREVALGYCRRHLHVAIVARRKAQLEEVAEQCRALGAASVAVIDADLATEEGCRDAFSRTLGAFDGELDILVLNHIVAYFSWWLPPTSDIEQQDIGAVGAILESKGGLQYAKKMMDVNALAYINLATMATPALLRSGRKHFSSGGGQIIVVGSMVGRVGSAKVAGYSATKHAIRGFFESLRIEYDVKQIPISITHCVVGSVSTENRNRDTAGQLLMAPIAEADGVASDIIVGGASRGREVYTPISQVPQALLLLDTLLPDVPANHGHMGQ